MGHKTGTLRIIGGKWRGRKLSFPAVDGLRPTTDRVRETLFNWLQGAVQGSRCLDLFAGSGALGFEALSRGAADVVFVESEKPVHQQLGQNLSLLHNDHGNVAPVSADQFLNSPASPFDIVFLDPPFKYHAIGKLCRQIEQSQKLKPFAVIYLEVPKNRPLDKLPDNWHITRDKTAGQVRYLLIERTSAGEEPV